MRDYVITINATVKVDAMKAIEFEDWLREVTHVVDLRHVPDTTEMYENDPVFRKLVQAERAARTLKMDYINEHHIDEWNKEK